MPLIRERLLDIYEREGFTVQTGHMMTFWYDTTHMTAFREMSSLWRGDQRMGTGWGMPWGELTVLEWLGDGWQPESIFIIGNAFGWSTVAMRLAFPWSRLLAIDSGGEGKEGRAGIDLTNKILTGLGGGQAMLATSPQDVPAAVEKLGGSISLAFIDGLHTIEQQALDFAAIQPFLASDHLVLFHDVLWTKQERDPRFHLEIGFQKIAATYPGRSAILSRTTVGIAVVWSAGMDAIGHRLTHMFVQPPVPDKFGVVR